MKWMRVEEGLPTRKYNRCFLAYFGKSKYRGRIFTCFIDKHGNYIIDGPTQDLCGAAFFPEFSHWTTLPEPPVREARDENNVSG